MRFAQAICSYPVVHFNAAVEHSTPRCSTPMEWAIIASLLVLQNKPEFLNVSIKDFCSRILRLTNVDSFIKSCLQQLMSVEALENNDTVIGEGVNLGEIPMSQLKVTESGRRMHNEGLLPGVSSTEYVNMDLDVLRNELSLHSKKRSLEATCTGVNVCDGVDLDAITLPSLQASDLLQKMQLERDSRLSWLNANSKIMNVQEGTLDEDSEKVSWDNHRLVLDISGNGVVTAEGVDDSMLVKLVDRFSGNTSIHAPKRDSVDFERDFENVAVAGDVKRLIENMMLNNRIYVCNLSQFTLPIKMASISKNGKSKGSPKILLQYGKDFACTFNKDDNYLDVCVPSNIQCDAWFGSTAFATESKQLNFNTFDVSVGTESREMVLGYAPKQRSFLLNDFVEFIVRSFGKNNCDLLNMLLMNRQQPLFNQLVYEIGNSMAGLTEKAQFLRNMNESNKRFMERTYISPDQEGRILFDNWITDNLTTQQAYEYAQSLDKESYIRNNANRMKAGFGELLKHWQDRSDLDLFWKILAMVGKSLDMQNFIASPAIAKELYTDDVIKLIFKKFGKISPDIKVFNQVESLLLELQKAYLKFQSKLASVGYKSEMSDAEKCKIVLGSSAKVRELNVLLKDLRGLYIKLARCIESRKEKGESEIENVDFFRSSDFPEFNGMIELLASVSRWLEPYLGADCGNFDKVYVADTCALMHHPELVEKFERNHSALVIPNVVLEELDKKKSDKDEAVAKQARMAIRTIQVAQGQKWCFMETSHPELLSVEYGADNNDNLILSVALHFLGNDPVLLTDDINFTNKAKSVKIPYEMVDTFLAHGNKGHR